ncbi:hypothetical protein SELMODRAFT_66363, partial [Selaginella moellendorffii]
GPRGSSLICGCTIHHRRLESALTAPMFLFHYATILLLFSVCSLLCPTEFAAHMAVV